MNPSFKESVDFIMSLDQTDIITRAKYLVMHPKDVTHWTGRHMKVNSGLFASMYTSTKYGNGSQRFEHYRNYLKEKLSDVAFVGNLLRLRGDILTCACSPNICHGHLLALVINFDRIDRLEEVANGSLAETETELSELIRRVKNEINPPPDHLLIPANPAVPLLFRHFVRDGETVNFVRPNVPFSYVNWPIREITVKFDRRPGHNDEYTDPATLADCKVAAGVIDYFWDRIIEAPGLYIPRSPIMMGDYVVSVNKTKMRLAAADRNGVTRGGWMTGRFGGYGFTWYCPPEALEHPAINPNPPGSTDESEIPTPEPQPPIAQFPSIIVKDSPATADAQTVREKRSKKFGLGLTPEESVNHTPLNTTINLVINNNNAKTTTESTFDDDNWNPALNQVINTSTVNVYKHMLGSPRTKKLGVGGIDSRKTLAPREKEPKENPLPSKKQGKEKAVDAFDKFWSKSDVPVGEWDSDESDEEEHDVSRRPRFRMPPVREIEGMPGFLLDVNPDDMDQTDEISPPDRVVRADKNDETEENETDDETEEDETEEDETEEDETDDEMKSWVPW